MIIITLRMMILKHKEKNLESNSKIIIQWRNLNLMDSHSLCLNVVQEKNLNFRLNRRKGIKQAKKLLQYLLKN